MKKMFLAVMALAFFAVALSGVTVKQADQLPPYPDAITYTVL